ncbi:MAG: hypothetical protein C0501_22255 [Isosphaera sp.]|nr:hypothetical protein [Isosphaera sp.]
MSRGAGWLTAGVVLLVLAVGGQTLLVQSAVESFRTVRGPDDLFDTVGRLSPWAGVVNLLFLGAGLALVAGVVLLVVDGTREPPRRSAAEEENRRLREENRRLRREREDRPRPSGPDD